MAHIFEFAPRQRGYGEPAQAASAQAAKLEGHDEIAFVALARLARQWQLVLEAEAEDSGHRLTGPSATHFGRKETTMPQMKKLWVAAENIAHFQEKLKLETDDKKRTVLEELLTREKALHKSLLAGN
jgi:hypothetical protein